MCGGRTPGGQRRGEEPPQPAGRPVSRKGRIATEQLIAAVSAQHDRGGGPGRPRQRVPGQEGRVAERLVEGPAPPIPEAEPGARGETRPRCARPPRPPPPPAPCPPPPP